jgi:hypothetical protein
MLPAKGALFPITGDLDLGRRDSQILQVAFDSLRAPLTEDEVVGTRSPLVAMAFDHKLLIGL